jgi:hypothetical protein
MHRIVLGRKVCGEAGRLGSSGSRVNLRPESMLAAEKAAFLQSADVADVRRSEFGLAVEKAVPGGSEHPVFSSSICGQNAFEQERTERTEGLDFAVYSVSSCSIF